MSRLLTCILVDAVNIHYRYRIRLAKPNGPLIENAVDVIVASFRDKSVETSKEQILIEGVKVQPPSEL